MKPTSALLCLSILSPLSYSAEQNNVIYINENMGFNVPGYKYAQSEMPCDIDKNLVSYLIEDSAKANLDMQAVSTAEKVNNGTIPVLLIDIEQLALGKEHSYGTTARDNLPKVQVTAALLIADQLETAKHTCAIATLNDLTPSSDILDLGVSYSICSATKKCLKDLSKDIVEWVVPQVLK
jgi:hypothetical protein